MTTFQRDVSQVLENKGAEKEFITAHSESKCSNWRLYLKAYSQKETCLRFSQTKGNVKAILVTPLSQTNTSLFTEGESLCGYQSLKCRGKQSSP